MRSILSRVWLILLCRVLMSAGYSLAFPYFAVYLSQERSVSLELIGAAMAASLLVSALAQILGGRAAQMQEALAAAAEVPLRTAAVAQKAHAAAKALAAAVSPAVVSDLNCALHLLKAAALCAAENVRINTSGLKDREKARALDARLDSLLQSV